MAGSAILTAVVAMCARRSSLNKTEIEKVPRVWITDDAGDVHSR